MEFPARPAWLELDGLHPLVRAVIVGVGALAGTILGLVLLGLLLTQTEEAFTWSGYVQQIVSGLAQG